MSLAALTARLRAANARFIAATDDLPNEVLETEVAVGVWTCRDVAAHIVDWNEEILLAARTLLGEISKPPHHPIADFDSFNHTSAARHAATPWAELKAALDDTVERAIAMAARFADRLDGEQIEHPWNNHGTIRDLFHGVCGHQEEHCEEIEQWRAERRLGAVERLAGMSAPTAEWSEVEDAYERHYDERAGE